MKKKLALIVFGALAFSATATAKVSDGQSYGDWKGVCQGNECAIVQVQSNAKDMPVGRIVLRKMPETGNNPVMIITVPLGVNLHAGLGIAVDGKELLRVPYDFCDQGGCNIALPLQGKELTTVKKGNKLQIAAFVGDDQQTIVFSLKGVTAAINAL